MSLGLSTSFTVALAITITNPAPNTVVGPGTVFRPSTSIVTFPLGGFWQVLIRSLAGENLLADGRSFLPETTTTLWPSVMRSSFGISTPLWIEQPAVTALPTPATYQIVVWDDLGQPIEQTAPIPVTWSPSAAGVAWVQSLTTSGTTEGSFTSDDRAMLEVVNNAVISSLPLNVSGGGVVELGLDAIQAGPPHELLGTSNDFILSGRGSIDRVSGTTGVNAYGCRWTLETAPLGLGKIEGVVNEYEQRIVQFALIKGGAGGFEYIDQLVNDHMGGGQMNWGIPFPKRLEYSILPFCTLRFRWLLFLQ